MVYQGDTYWVGSHKLLKDFSASLSDVLAEMMVQYESDGNSIVYFGRGTEVLAVVAIADQIKPTSAEAVKELKRQGIDICMLTGDGQRTALAVAGKLGIDRFVADALPDDKEDFIRERMVNAVIDTLKSIIPAPMLEKRLSSHSIRLRHSKSE